jgi:Activator of Hsp90 ATPase homolog 1-like protein
MDDQHFTLAFSIDKTPKEVFDAISNVRGWWTENLDGSSQQLNDEFEVRFGDVHYSRQKLVEVVSPKKVTWLVTDSKLSFIKDKQEWTNTRIEFDITSVGNKTQVRFTHVGLAPDVECYDACSNAWSDYITNSLRKLITTGKGKPTAEGEPEQKKT